jgi:nucleoside-diphosphate-sugar epimerase
MDYKKVFVTGGLGFIGHRLVKTLVSQGYEVIVYDMAYTYTDPAETNYSKILKLRMDEIKGEFKLVRGDIRNEFDLYEAVKENKPDCFIHLAAIPIASIAAKYHEDAINNNLKGTIAALETIRRVDSVKHFVYTSSSMVYGDFVRTPVTENDPCNPIELYGATKLCSEVLTKTFNKMYGMDYTIVRPSAVNGSGAINRSVLQLFCQQALANKPITLKGGEDTMLDFTHVDDVASAFSLILKNKNSLNQTFNITKGHANSLKELVDILKAKFPGLQITEEENEIKMPKRGTLDISKAKKLLGYEPKHDVKDCVESYIEFYKKVIE